MVRLRLFSMGSHWARSDTRTKPSDPSRRGLSALRDNRAVLNVAYALMVRAENYAKLGRPVEGLNCLIEAAQR